MPRSALAVLAVVVLTARSAAGEPPGRPVTSPLGGKDVRALGFVGAFGDATDGNVGSLGGAAAFFRFSLLEVGILGQGGREVSGYGLASGAALAGLALQTARGWRADILGEFGFDHYAGIGAGAPAGSPGAAATLPFVGWRFGVAYRFRRAASVHPEIGVWGVIEDDLARRPVRFTCPAPCGAPDGGPAQITRTVGSERFSALLSVGFSFDLR